MRRGYPGKTLVVLWLLGWTLVVGCPAGTAVAASGDGAASFDILAERIGPLHLGMSAKDALAQAGCKKTARSKPEFYEGATGEYVRMAHLPGCGLELKLSGERKGGAKTVAGITVTAPSRFATSQGIGIGADEKQVTAAYGRYRDAEGVSKPGEVFVAGSIYDGLIFTFKNGRVTQIFLGAAAE